MHFEFSNIFGFRDLGCYEKNSIKGESFEILMLETWDFPLWDFQYEIFRMRVYETLTIWEFPLNF